MMTKEELAQKIKDSNYTCAGIHCNECISVNGFNTCLQEDRRLFVSLVLPTKSKLSYAKLEKENAELKEQLRLAKEMPYSAVKKFAEEKTQEQLTKAKELIKTLLLIADNKVSEMEFQLCVADAKQFIGEVDK